MKKKLLFLLPAAAMVLAGCGNGGGESTDTPTSGDPTSQTPTSTTPVVKSDLQIAYEAGLAVHSGDETRDEYTFSGVATAIIGNSFFLQKEGYGMYVYNKPTEGLAVGKTVSVTAKIKNYSGLVETGTISASAVTGDGELPASSAVESLASLSALNQNVLCHTAAVLKTIKTAYVPSATAGLYTFTIGEDDVTIKVDKYVTHASVATSFVKANIGETFNLGGLLTSVYNEEKQILFASTSTIEMTPRVITSLAVKTAPTKLDYIAGQSFEPAGLVITVNYEGGASEDVPYAGNEDLFTLTPSGVLSAGTDHIAIGYKGSSVNQPITVIEDTLESIALSGDMTKKSYYKGDDVDASGLFATGHYENSGDQDITSNVSWVYTEGSIATAGATSLHVKAVFNTVESTVKEVTGIEVNVKSSLQVAYEAAADLASGGTTTDEFTYSGVVSSTLVSSIFIQYDGYGMWVYGGKSDSTTVGKWVTITSKLQNYYGALESKGTVVPSVGSTRVAPESLEIVDNTTLANNSQDLLAHATGYFVSKNKAWSSSDNSIAVFNIGGNNITIKFDKLAFNADKAAIVNALTAGDRVSLTGLLTTNNNGTAQLMTSSEVAISPVAVSSISVEDAPTKLSYDVGESFDPTGLVIRVNYADSTSEAVPYAGNESLFAFNPSGALAAEDDKVTITYKGANVDQAITVVNRTLESIVIDGVMSKKSYILGKTWDPTGLTAEGHYSDSSTKDLTSVVEWTFDPATPNSTSIDNIDVVASYSGVNSSAYNQDGITVAGTKLDFAKFGTTLSTTEATSETEFTLSTYSFKYKNGKKSTDSLFLVKDKGYVYNSTAIPASGRIAYITVETPSNAAAGANYTVAFSASAISEKYTTGGEEKVIGKGVSYTFDCEVANAKYFCISVDNAANGQILNLSIVYVS